MFGWLCNTINKSLWLETSTFVPHKKSITWRSECVKRKLKQEATSCKPYLLLSNVWPFLFLLFLCFHLSPILTLILFSFTLLSFHLLDSCWKNKWSIRQGSHLVEPCHKKVLWNNCTWEWWRGFFFQIYEIVSLAKRDVT
jgi:hypothetical protein